MEGLGYEAEIWITRVLTCFNLLAVGAALIAALVAAARAKKDGMKTVGLWILAGTLGISALNGLCFFGIDLAEASPDTRAAMGSVGMLVEIAITIAAGVGLLLLRVPDGTAEAP